MGWGRGVENNRRRPSACAAPASAWDPHTGFRSHGAGHPSAELRPLPDGRRRRAAYPVLHRAHSIPSPPLASRSRSPPGRPPRARQPRGPQPADTHISVAITAATDALHDRRRRQRSAPLLQPPQPPPPSCFPAAADRTTSRRSSRAGALPAAPTAAAPPAAAAGAAVSLPALARHPPGMGGEEWGGWRAVDPASSSTTR